MKDVTIPEGTERIGNHWFWSSGIENVTVPASVREIGADAFYGCDSLKRVTIALGSQLEKLGENCFCKSGIEALTLPGAVKEVGRGAFSYCDSLKTVRLEGDHEVDLSCSEVPDST